MAQLSTLQMTDFTQQRPSIWATSQLISSEQFKWGSWLLKSNLSALDYTTPPFPSTACTPSALPNHVLSKIPIPVLWPSAWMHSALTTFEFLLFSTTYVQKISCPALIKITPNSLSFLSLGLQVTEEQQCFIGPTELACASSWVPDYSESEALLPGQQSCSTCAPYTLQAAHVHQLAACLGECMSLQCAVAKSSNTWSLWSHKP